MTKRILLLLIGIFTAVYTVLAQGIQHHAPGIYGFHPLYEDVRIVSPLLEEHPVVFEIQSSLFKDTAIIDFEKRQITFLRYDTYTGIPIWEFHYDELDEYFRSIRRFSIAVIWYESGMQPSMVEEKKLGPPKLELTMPVHYPAWARRVLGKEPPKLSIKGFQSITVSVKRRRLETGTVEEDEKPTGGFGFDYNNMFTIRGSIGRLISIEIKTGKDKESEDLKFRDQMKKLKIEYKADPDSADQLEDEIIQEVVAGYTNFQMPGQGLAGYSGSHEGLFGIKVRSQWGPLSLTAIVSRENAETQKKILDPTGKTAGQTKTGEADYLRNIYFFLDSIYLLKYVGATKTAVPEVKDLRIFKLESNEFLEKDNPQDYVYAGYGDKTSFAMFRKLRDREDYEFDRKNGWIRFLRNRPTDNDLIAIYMHTSDENVIPTKGDTTSVNLIGGKAGITNLWVLKNKLPDCTFPKDSSYFLMWRNVYTLPHDARPDDFKIEVLRIIDERGEKYKSRDSLFSFILGITDKDGNADPGNEKIFDFEEKYIIIPPYIYSKAGTTVYSNRPFENPALGELPSGWSNINKDIYYDTSTIKGNSKYEIVTTGTSRQTYFQLGWGIMPNTETVKTKGGTKLEKGKDYIIDYEFGSIELISDRAKAASEIEVEYQQESLFMFESKTFLGAYGKLDLPNIGRESYLATTVMGQFTGSKDKIPRVGNEPFNRFLFDTNLRLDFEPEWMTDFVNLIPLISTASQSSATMDFEVAYSRMAPNKANKGEAYIDNFQSSERTYPLGESHSLWHQASPSVEWSVGDSMLYHPPAWKSYWYMPVKGDNRTKTEEIWELETDKKKATQEEYLSTLRMVCQPLPKDSTLLANVKNSSDSIVVNPWTGIMTPIPSSLQDKKRDKYLEFWIKNSEKRGVLYVDMGEVSEDLSLDGGPPNLMSNRENYEARPGEYKEKYDKGLDTLRDTAEVYLFPNIHRKEWVRLSYGDSLLGEFINDPARDNWKRYSVDHKENRSKVNGTELDNYLSSEDLNGDGFSKKENFFRVRIDFSNPLTSNCLDTAKTKSANIPDSGWQFFRIPLNIPNDTVHFHKIVGSPSWERISFVRLLWTDFGSDNVKTQENRLEFTEMKFTGNQWQEIATGDSGDVKITPTVLNTIDDKGYYYRPLYTDSTDKENRLKKDYALRLEYKDLKHGEEALVKRDIPSYQKIDLSSYDEIRMYIKDTLSAIYKSELKIVNILDSMYITEKDLIRFVFRFGRSDSCYYEFRTSSLKNHWRMGKGLRISLKKLSEMKQAYHAKYGERLDSINVIDTLEDGSRLQIFSKTGVLPVFSDIRWMAFGVVRDEGAIGFADGELWINGLRVKGIKSIDGWAFRANLSTHWGDFMDLSANLNYDDADFRQMSEDAVTIKDATVSAGANAQWTVSKFLPDIWGVNVPFGTGVSASLARPKRRPGSDIFLTRDNGEADRLGDMAEDFADLIFNSDLSGHETDAEHYEKSTINRTWYSSYSKTADAENPVTDFTADRITTNYNYSRDSTTESEGLLPEKDRPKLKRKNIGDDHINVVTTRAHGASLKYDLTPRHPPEWTSYTPFTKIKAKRFPRYVKDYKFGILPSRFNFDLVGGTFTKTYTYRSIEDIEAEASVERTVENLGLSHGFQFAYSPISPLIETNYDIIVNRNFDEALAEWGYDDKHDESGEFIKRRVFELDPVWRHYWITYAENSRSQNASLRFDPQFFDWLTHTADYRGGYSHTPRTLDGNTGYLNAKVLGEFGFSSNFRIRSFLTSCSERTEKLKGLSNVFSGMEKGLDKISLSAFNFTYNASLDLNNDYLGTDFLRDRNIWRWDYFKYQLGVKNRGFKDIMTGNMNDVTDFGGMRYRSRLGYDEILYNNDQRITRQNYTISTSMRLPRPIDVTINPISLGWRRDYTIVPDTTYMDSTITFPEFQIGANSNVLERIPFVQRSMKNLGLRSIYRLSKSTHKSYLSSTDLTIRYDVTLGHAWDPLINIDGLIERWPINIDYTYSFTTDSTVSLVNDTVLNESGVKIKNYGNVWNVKYTIPGKPDREIKMFNRWSIKIKGDLVMSMNVSFNSTITSRDTEEEEERDWAFILHPLITYDLTDNIDGLMEYIFEKSYDYSSETTNTNNTFACTITIYFK